MAVQDGTQLRASREKRGSVLKAPKRSRLLTADAPTHHPLTTPSLYSCCFPAAVFTQNPLLLHPLHQLLRTPAGRWLYRLPAAVHQVTLTCISVNHRRRCAMHQRTQVGTTPHRRMPAQHSTRVAPQATLHSRAPLCVLRCEGSSKWRSRRLCPLRLFTLKRSASPLRCGPLLWCGCEAVDSGLPGVPQAQPGAARAGQVGAATKALAKIFALDIAARAGRCQLQCSPWTVCRKVPCPGQRRPLPLLHALLHACDGAAANAAAPHTCCAAAPHDIPRRYRRRTRRPRRRDGAARDEWSAVDCRQVARQLARCHGGQGRVSGREGAPP